MEVARLMEKLGCSEAEAMDIIASDKRIDKGEKLFELPKEKQEVAKKMARAERAPTAYKFTQRERKPNNEKRNLISMLVKFLEPHVDEKIEITNEEREINFKMQGVKYRIILSCPRK